MKKVSKYNLFKGISTLLSGGTPIITLLCCGDFITKTPESTISATGIIAILLACLLLKDKIAENFKVPSAFVISIVGLVLILLVENLLQPMKIVFITTALASGVDEVTFKKVYKALELGFPAQVAAYKKFGFVFTTTETLEGDNS